MTDVVQYGITPVKGVLAKAYAPYPAPAGYRWEYVYNGETLVTIDGVPVVVLVGAPVAKASELIARFTTPPSDFVATLINSTVLSLQHFNIWDNADALGFTAAEDAQSAQRNWITDAYNLTPQNSPTFTANLGYAGNGSNADLDTGFNPSTAVAAKFTKDDASFGLYINNAINGFTAEMAASDGTNIAMIRANNSGLLRSYINATAQNSSPGPVSTSRGLSTATRTASNASQHHKDGVLVGSSGGGVPSTALPNGSFRLLSQRSVAQLSAARVAFWFIGKPVDQANLFKVVRAHLGAIGAL